jgi:hypothetical protein
LSQSSADLIEELQLTLRSSVQQTDWGVRMVVGAGNRDVDLADTEQHPPKSGTASDTECVN